MPADLDIVSWSSITALNFIIPLSYNFTSTVFTYHSSSIKLVILPISKLFPISTSHFLPPFLEIKLFFFPGSNSYLHLPCRSSSFCFCLNSFPPPLYLGITLKASFQSYNLTMLLIPLYYLYNLPTGSPLNSPAHPWRQPHPS